MSYDREEVRKALDYWTKPLGLDDVKGKVKPVPLTSILDVAQAFVDGRLIDRQTLDYEAATQEVIEGLETLGAASREPLLAPAAQLWAKVIVRAAVGEGEQ